MTESLFPQNTERPLLNDIDLYKFPMGQLALEKHPDAEVTFTFKNRSPERPIINYIDIEELNERFDQIREQGFTAEEIAALAGMQAQDGTSRFDSEYLDFLANLKLCEIDVSINPDTFDLAIETKGQWANASLLETVIMSEVNEQYFRNYLKQHNLSEAEVWAEGDRRLDEKIAFLQQHPDVKFADFGTRRRFSAAWHEHVIQRFIKELPSNFIGTSNPWLAYKYGLTATGTNAHEMPMVYAALADQAGQNPLEGQSQMLIDWYERFGEAGSIALPDTFTTKYFLSQFSEEQARNFKGFRQDSGDPFEFGENLIDFYEQREIDPRTKQVIFSDSLDVYKMAKLTDTFGNRVATSHGWGTDAMNDMGFGIKANNIVMKPTSVNGVSTVKLSDDPGKHTGTLEQVRRYQSLVDARLLVDKALQEVVRA